MVAVVVGNLGDRSYVAILWLALSYLPMLGAGVLIAAVRPRSPLGWLLLVVTMSLQLGALTTAMVTHSDLAAGSEEWWAWAGDLLWWLGFPVLPLVVLHVPDGRLASSRWRAVIIAWASCWAVMGLGILVARSPFGLADPPGPLLAVVEAASIGVLATFVAALAGLVLRYRAGDRRRRRSLAWPLGTVAVGIVGLLVTTALDLGDDSPVTQGVIACFTLALPLALCVGALGDNLPGIDRVAGRALVYALSALFLTGLYVAVVVSVGGVLGASETGVVAVLATAGVAVLFAPVRDLIGSVLDRRLFGDISDHGAAVLRLGRAFGDGDGDGDGGDLARSLAQAVAEAVASPYVALRTPDAAVEHGQCVEPTEHRELVWAGGSVGSLTVSMPGRRRRGQDPAVLIDALCPFLAAALGAASAADRARESRAEILSAIENERRRIRRDLHDGLGPSLAGIGLGLDTIHNLVEVDPDEFDVPAVQGLVNRLRDDVTDAYDDVRLLVRGLRPPTLDALGLAGALRAQVDRLMPREGSLNVVLDLDEKLDALPPGVELAAYHIAMEAITNVVRHSDGHLCDVRLRRGRELELDVRDDGRGLGVAHRPGVGLVSMRERCEQLGGRFSIGPSHGRGTLVTARLPIE